MQDIFRWQLPLDISEHGHRSDALIEFVHWFMAVLFIGWGIYFIYCLIRFRARAGHQPSTVLPKAKAAKWVEIGVVIPNRRAMLDTVPKPTSLPSCAATVFLE